MEEHDAFISQKCITLLYLGTRYIRKNKQLSARLRITYCFQWIPDPGRLFTIYKTILSICDVSNVHYIHIMCICSILYIVNGIV